MVGRFVVGIVVIFIYYVYYVFGGLLIFDYSIFVVFLYDWFEFRFVFLMDDVILMLVWFWRMGVGGDGG